jgi:23S rRNA pseudouridine1911/1915/1917 synthase
MQSLGHAVVGDTLYGAPHAIAGLAPELNLTRNFLHAAHLAFVHPQTGKQMDIQAPLPVELDTFLTAIKTASSGVR